MTDQGETVPQFKVGARVRFTDRRARTYPDRVRVVKSVGKSCVYYETLDDDDGHVVGDGVVDPGCLELDPRPDPRVKAEPAPKTVFEPGDEIRNKNIPSVPTRRFVYAVTDSCVRTLKVYPDGRVVHYPISREFAEEHFIKV